MPECYAPPVWTPWRPPVAKGPDFRRLVRAARLAHEADNSADRIVEKIVADLSDRRGLRHAWEAIDPDIQEDIRARWAAIIQRELRRPEVKHG